MNNVIIIHAVVLLVVLFRGTAEATNSASTTHLRQLAAVEHHKNETYSFFDLLSQWKMEVDMVLVHNSTENQTRQDDGDDVEGNFFANELCAYVFEPLGEATFVGSINVFVTLFGPADNGIDFLFFVLWATLSAVLVFPITIPYLLLGCSL